MNAIFSLGCLPAQARATNLIEDEEDVAFAGQLAHHRGIGNELALLGGDTVVLDPPLVGK